MIDSKVTTHNSTADHKSESDINTLIDSKVTTHNSTADHKSESDINTLIDGKIDNTKYWETFFPMKNDSYSTTAFFYGDADEGNLTLIYNFSNIDSLTYCIPLNPVKILNIYSSNIDYISNINVERTDYILSSNYLLIGCGSVTTGLTPSYDNFIGLKIYDSKLYTIKKISGSETATLITSSLPRDVNIKFSYINDIINIKVNDISTGAIITDFTPSELPTFTDTSIQFKAYKMGTQSHYFRIYYNYLMIRR